MNYQDALKLKVGDKIVIKVVGITTFVKMIKPSYYPYSNKHYVKIHTTDGLCLTHIDVYKINEAVE